MISSPIFARKVLMRLLLSPDGVADIRASDFGTDYKLFALLLHEMKSDGLIFPVLDEYVILFTFTGHIKDEGTTVKVNLTKLGEDYIKDYLRCPHCPQYPCNQGSSD